MKRVGLLALVIYVVVVACANFLTLSLLSNETNSLRIMLTLCSLGFLSVALLAALASLVICYITKRPDGLNKLRVLRIQEERIAAQVIGQKKMHSDDEWEELHEQDIRNYITFLMNKGDTSCLN